MGTAISSVLRLVAVASVLGTGIGCGSSRPTFPVTGEVVYTDGSTLPLGGQVIFQSVGMEPPVTAKGYFGADGKFTLSKFSEGKGAVEGEYKVAVLPLVPDDRGAMSQVEYLRAMNPIAGRYKSPETSGLRYTVSADTAPHEFRIEVERPPRG